MTLPFSRRQRWSSPHHTTVVYESIIKLLDLTSTSQKPKVLLVDRTRQLCRTCERSGLELMSEIVYLGYISPY